MTDLDLAAIRERANNATKGPWEYVDDYFGVRQVPTEAHRTGRTEYEVEGIVPGEYIRDYDAVFIAHARTDIPNLLDHVDALRTRIETYDGLGVTELHDRLAAVRELADMWASTGEPATKERQAALKGAARRLHHALDKEAL